MARELALMNELNPTYTIPPTFQFAEGRKVTVVRLVHNSNAFCSMLVMDAGISMEVIAVSVSAHA